MENYKISCIFKFLIFIIGLISIIATSGILDNNLNLDIFTMFTTITNVLCTIYFLIEFIYQLKLKKIKNFSHILKNTLMMSITLTLLVAHFVLKMRFSFNSFVELSFLGVHYIMPILIIIDWLIFDKKGTIKKYEPIIYLIMPLIYFVISLLAAEFGNGLGCNPPCKYPYPFLDVYTLGIKQVMINCIFIAIGCIVIGYTYFLTDNILKKKKRK